MKLTPLKRIAAIHDLSGLGKCSLTVALPVISATGVECACIPTALLSTHTGEFTGFTFHDLSDQIMPIARHWAEEGAVFDGIYSGYLGSPRQAELLEEALELLSGEKTLYIADPVMADNGEYYSNLDSRTCEAFRRLCRRADVITPNITEASFLTGVEYKSPPHDNAYVDRLLAGLLALGPKAVALTGVHPPGMIGTATRSLGEAFTYYAMRPARDGLFYGTGDLFASGFAALLVRGARLEDALDTATMLVDESIERSLERGSPRRFGVDFEGALPSYIRRVGKLFDER